MQRSMSLFVLSVTALTVTVACSGGATQAQHTPTPYVVSSMRDGVDGAVEEVITATGELDPLNPAILEQIQKELLAGMANDTVATVSGKETTGQVITIAGKAIKLPANVYSEAVIVSAECIGKNCPEFPIYVLRYSDSDVSITVSEKSGKITDNDGVTAETAASNRATFQWLADVLAK